MLNETVAATNKADQPIAARCGSWTSPITADLITGESISIEDFAIAGSDIFWTERRPREGGRTVLVRRRDDGNIDDITPAPFNVRTRVHEYGGGGFSVSKLGIFFCSFDDQRLYRVGDDGTPEALTHASAMRYADIVADPLRNRLIAVREDHSTGASEPVNAIVAIELQNGNESVLAGGHDFFSNPIVSPDGQSLAWLSWDHPNMPWDGTELWMAVQNSDGALGPARLVAGGVSESIFQPLWSPQGALHFVSDRSGWWNLYREHGGTAQPLHPMEAEFGQPQWVFGMSTYGFDARGNIVCLYTRDGLWRLAFIDPLVGSFDDIATPFCDMWRIRVGADFALVFLFG